MRITQLHPWAMPYAQAIALQRELSSRVDVTPHIDISTIKTVAGVDVSSTRFDKVLTAGVVVWNRETGEILETTSHQAESEFPYIPGLLSFREIPVLSTAIEKLTVTPDAFMVDGQGIAHPRGMGIAAHLGLLIDVPAVGVAKSRLCGTHEEPGPSAGDREPLMLGDKQIGVVLRSKAKSKPLIISPGNRMTMQNAVELTLACLRGYRLPEPTRLAHLHVNAVRTGKEMKLAARPTPLF